MSHFSKLIPAGTPADNYTKYLETFASEFLTIVKLAEFQKILSTLSQQKSYRTLNREVRKACDQYCTDNKIMSHREFQARWFYEQTMLGRIGIGAKAPWIGNVTTVSRDVKEMAVKISLEAKPVREDKKAYPIHPSNRNDGWVKVKGGAYRKFQE